MLAAACLVAGAALSGGVTLAWPNTARGIPRSPAANASSTRVHIYRDRRGRPIRIVNDVASVDPRVYAQILRDTVHGREIARMTVQIVASRDVSRICRAEALGCYDRGTNTIVAPAGSRQDIEWPLLHEYGHHLDEYRRGVGPELNGGRFWYKARAIRWHLSRGHLGYGNSVPHDREVREVWAEDYAALHLETGACPQPIGCLTAKARRGMLRDITGRRWRKPDARAITRLVSVSAGASPDDGVDIDVPVPHAGGRLVASVAPATSIPEDGSTCTLKLYRDDRLLNLESGEETVRLEWPYAVGGTYVVRVGHQGLGCQGEARITVA